MIARVDHAAKHNPIPAHLRIVPKDDVPLEERAQDIARELRAASFDSDKSRVIVFCSTRRQTEEESDLFEAAAAAEDCWRGRVGYFHAGMGKEDRDEIFERFKDGRVVVLFATKAFGMGMDVPSIHYVFHHTPPSSLEDYLQEIGRAGRNAGSRQVAGFSEEAPIRCVLYASPADFKAKKDKLHKGHLSWVELPRIQTVLHRYAVRIGALKASHIDATDKFTPPKYFPLALDLIEQADEFREVKNPEAIQRMGLYWLEQLGRVHLGDYLPAHLEFENKEVGTAAASSQEVQALCRLVAQARLRAPHGDATLLLSMADMLKEVRVEGFSELFKVIAQAQKQGLVYLARYLKLRITKKRAGEIEEWTQSSSTNLPPFLEAAYALTHSVLRAIPDDRTLELDLEWLGEESRKLAEEYLAPMENTDEAMRLAQRDQKDFLRPSRARAALRTVQECPGVLLRRELRDDGATYLLRIDKRVRKNATSYRNLQESFVRQHHALAGRLLRRIQAAQKTGTSINLIDLLIEEEVPDFDISFLERVLLFLRWMGYIRVSSILPMAIEAYLHSVRPVSSTDDGEDRRIYAMYDENRRLKMLRLAALQALVEIRDHERQIRFIEKYFTVESADDVLGVIEGAVVEVDPKHPLIQELRHAALQELERKLSDEQRAVYQASVHRSIVVVAGPGSGKTHTLLLRLARLIHEENVDPASILVLAYNRAVVAEIKHRLNSLLGKLGYRSLVKSLRVFTFHGLIKYCLRDELDDLDLKSRDGGDPWVERFLKIAEQEPGKIYRWLDPETIRYVFIDEFQDITEPRYELLRWIARPHCSVMVIGDPNQSIYGYERVASNADTRASEPYFDRFQQDYQAREYRLLKNFRSFEQIIRAAENLISLNEDRRLHTPLVAMREASEDWAKDNGYVHRIGGADTKWFDLLQRVLEERNERGEPYREVALLFRSNQEVYLAYRRIQDRLRDWLRQHSVNVSVQGDGVSLTRTREVAYLLDKIRSHQNKSFECKGHDRLPSGYIEKLIQQVSETRRPAAWSSRSVEVFLAVLREYESEGETNPTFTDLLDFIDEILRKDHGQLYKLIQISAEEHGRVRTVPDIVLSNIHKVKGLEFDAVIMPPSFVPLPFEFRDGRPLSVAELRSLSDEKLKDMMEEERRVYYVGITRARDRFVGFEWRREQALKNGTPFHLNEKINRQLGIPFNGNPYDGRVILFKCANRDFVRRDGGFRDEAEYMNYLHRKVGVGDPVQLVRNGRRWYVRHGPHCIATLSRSGSEYVDDRLSAFEERHPILEGLVVTEVIRHTFEEATQIDSERGTDYTKRWSSYFAEKTGFTYVVNFAGYATPQIGKQ